MDTNSPLSRKLKHVQPEENIHCSLCGRDMQHIVHIQWEVFYAVLFCFDCIAYIRAYTQKEEEMRTETW